MLTNLVELMSSRIDSDEDGDAVVAGQDITEGLEVKVDLATDSGPKEVEMFFPNSLVIVSK
jgi:hypothetical protein